MDLFGFLDGISPWWWIAFGVVLGVVEMVSFSFFLIWPGLAAVIVGLSLVVFPDMSGSVQLGLFAVVSIVLTVLGRMYVARFRGESESTGLNERSARMVGRQAIAIGAFAGGEGVVTVGDTRWSARLEPGRPDVPEGAPLRVTDVDGMVLVVAPRDG